MHFKAKPKKTIAYFKAVSELLQKQNKQKYNKKKKKK